ncbi:MAG: SRPBCC family protein [Actinobacteria bacterium]|jgi:carbon monoxide dehydrogenase subunit G|nr:SRPBCC family protein [Actinomycetota bacterium]
MELNHHFTVNVPVAEAWKILTNVELIAPCLPGAQLQEVEGDTYRGVVKVKVGPIQAQFKGQASFLERNDVDHKAVLKGEGRDTGGKGNASALITAQLTSISATSTKVEVNTDLAITGKVAQFGRGAMADISDKLLAQFSENLNTLISEIPSDAAAEPAVAEVEEVAAPSASAEPVVRKIDAPEAAPINLLDAAGSTMLKRALPVVAGIAVLVVILIAVL